MPGEPILIIDDTPVNLKLTRILLANEGYEVRTAPDAEEALAMLENFRPALMLVDIQLPGMDGLELTRRVKANPRFRDIVVVALTAFAMKGDEQRARDAGCDGYITKPIDTRALPVRIREYLSRDGHSTAPPNAGPGATDPLLDAASPEVDSLRRRFLTEGSTQSREILDALGAGFRAAEARKVMHQWVGAAGLLGYREISSAARELEEVLREPPFDNSQVREMLIGLIFAFSDPPESAPRPAPPPVLEALAGRRIAIVGATGAHTERIFRALAGVHAVPVRFPPNQPPDSEEIGACDLVLVQVGSDTLPTGWLSPDVDCGKPQILVGDRETLTGLDDVVRAKADDFLMDAWHPGEALVRAGRALTSGRARGQFPASSTSAGGCPKVLLAGIDPAVVPLVRATLQNCGMEAESAGGGIEALDRIRREAPAAAVVDLEVNGLELLAGIRSGGAPVRVVLVAAPQQEADVVRALSLGADDYVVKPFSHLELAARLRHILRR